MQVELATGCYLCKFSGVCTRFDNVASVPVVILGIGRQPKTIQKLNSCTHGGGSGCSRWRRFTSKEIGWFEPYKNRAKPRIAVTLRCNA